MNSQLIVALATLLTSLFTVTSAFDDCPPRKVDGKLVVNMKHRDKCLYFLGSQFIHDTAVNKCSSINATLITIDTRDDKAHDEESAVIRSQISKNYPDVWSAFYWITDNLDTLDKKLVRAKRCPILPSGNEPECPSGVMTDKEHFYCNWRCNKNNVHTICQRVKPSVPSTTPMTPVTSESTKPVDQTSTTAFTYRPKLTSDKTTGKLDEEIGLPVRPVMPPDEFKTPTSDYTPVTPVYPRLVKTFPATTISPLPWSSSTPSPYPLMRSESSTRDYSWTVTPRTSTTTQYACNSGFTLVDNRCYRLFIGPIEGNDIRFKCLELSAKPAAITSSKVNEFFKSRIFYEKDPVFLGARLIDRGQGTQHYVWTNEKGDIFRFANWAAGEPNTDNGDCIVMRKDGKWQSYRCSEKAQYTCELPASIKIEESASTSPSIPLERNFESTVSQDLSTASVATRTTVTARTSTSAETLSSGTQETTTTTTRATTWTTRRVDTDPTTVSETDGEVTSEVSISTDKVDGTSSDLDSPVDANPDHGNQLEESQPRNKASAYAAFILIATFIILIIICLAIKGHSVKKRRQMKESEKFDESERLKATVPRKPGDDETRDKLLNPYSPYPGKDSAA